MALDSARLSALVFFARVADVRGVPLERTEILAPGKVRLRLPGGIRLRGPGPARNAA
jgi:hypothetical protein